MNSNTQPQELVCVDQQDTMCLYLHVVIQAQGKNVVLRGKNVVLHSCACIQGIFELGNCVLFYMYIIGRPEWLRK